MASEGSNPRERNLPKRVTESSYPASAGTNERRASSSAVYVRHPAGSLPLALTSFVGREREVVDITRLLNESRLVTIRGAGGAGKTRLAMAVAAGMAESMGEEALDWACWVWLATLSDAELVPRAVAAALDLPETPGRPQAEVLSEHIGDRTVLLVLDNCEHLIDPCAELVEGLLRSCPGLRVLATSRELLGVSGETSRMIPSLSLPEGRGAQCTEELLPYEATRLFVERAKSVVPGFAPTGHEASAVVRVCRRLEGIPLAIELAAARTRALSVQQISDRLDDVFRLLVGGGRMLPDRQRTLRATMDWSYDLLSEKEKIVFRRLSAFAGGFSLEAAEEVCAGWGIEVEGVLDPLSRLVDKSLVVVTERRGGTRYRLLQTVRLYAAEKLEAAEEERVTRRRHALFFLDLVEGAESGLTGSGQTTWLHRLESDLDNLRAAMRWLGETSETEAHLRLAGALWRFCYLRGFYEEGRGWLGRALAGRGEASPTYRAKALVGAGVLDLLQCEYDLAKDRLEDALVLYRGLGDERGVASALQVLGSVARERGDYPGAAALHGESLASWRELGDEAEAARSLNYLGFVAWLQGDYGRAREVCEETLILFRDLGDSEGVVWALISLGVSAQHAGSPDRARTLLEESLALSREVGYREGVAWSLDQLGNLALSEDDAGRAVELLQESLEVHRDLGDRWRAASVLEGLAEALCAQGHFELSARLFGAAETVREAISAPVPPCERARLDGAVAVDRAGMSEDAFATARTLGRGMTLDQALTETRRAPRSLEKARAARPAGLTERETEVLRVVAEGLTDAQVAERLVLSPRTVNHHLRSIYRKLGVPSRAAAAKDALERGLI